MTDKVRMGFIGVGLMGHGAARNILESGHFPLTILGNRNRGPVDDLVERGAREAASPADLAASSDVVFLCLPSVGGGRDSRLRPERVIGGLSRGAVLIDTTTSDPSATRADRRRSCRSRGVDMLDAALGRTPREAEAGKLSTYVGGEVAVLDRVRPILADLCRYDRPLRTAGRRHDVQARQQFDHYRHGRAVCRRIRHRRQARGRSRRPRRRTLGGRRRRANVEDDGAWIRTGDDSRLRGPIRIAAKDVPPTTAWPSPSAAQFPSCNPSIGPSDLPSIAATRRYFCPRCPAFLQT